MHYFIFTVLLWSHLTGFLQANEPIVTINLAEKVLLHKNQPSVATIKIMVAKGFHIQANPAADKYLIPTTLATGKHPEINFDAPVYPAGKPFQLLGSPKAIQVYDGLFHITLPLQAANDAKLGELIIPSTLRYQACNEKNCLFPKTIKFDIAISVVAAQEKK